MRHISEMITVDPLPSPGTTIGGTVVVVVVVVAVDKLVAVVDFSRRTRENPLSRIFKKNEIEKTRQPYTTQLSKYTLIFAGFLTLHSSGL